MPMVCMLVLLVVQAHVASVLGWKLLWAADIFIAFQLVEEALFWIQRIIGCCHYVCFVPGMRVLELVAGYCQWRILSTVHLSNTIQWMKPPIMLGTAPLLLHHSAEIGLGSFFNPWQKLHAISVLLYWFLIQRLVINNIVCSKMQFW